MKNALARYKMLLVFWCACTRPLLTGLDSQRCTLGAGIGTLLTQLITRRSVPIFLASSCIHRSYYVCIQTWYWCKSWGGFNGSRCCVCFNVSLIKVRGALGFLAHKLLPPAVVGPVIMVII
ncbi:hypothetical protein OK016_04525 [Vibrio chagasii]|nr:hypothetical protein [Vibrio chagasii]